MTDEPSIHNFRIEDDTPIPKRGGPGGRRRSYPWGEMRPGQCIVLDSRKAYVNAQHSARTYRKKDPTFDFTARQCDDGQYRVWRVVPRAEPNSSQ